MKEFFRNVQEKIKNVIQQRISQITNEYDIEFVKIDVLLSKIINHAFLEGAYQIRIQNHFKFENTTDQKSHILKRFLLIYFIQEYQI